jgi:hypothetical protein
MAVQDDLRRLSELDSIFLGWGATATVTSGTPVGIVGWYKGRLQQANDGAWIFRSISSDGDVVGFQLGNPNPNWTSNESPSTGIVVVIPILNSLQQPPITFQAGIVFLQQQIPAELTN